MSHQVQLSPVASHRPNCRPGTPLTRRPAAADVRTPPAGQDMCRILPTRGDPIYTGIFRTSAKASRTSPRTSRQDQSARSCRDPAICPLAGPISREEGTDAGTPAGTWRAALHTGPSGQRSASKAHDRDRPAEYPGATCHRPPRNRRPHQMQASPDDHAGHPILPMMRKGTTWSHSQRDGCPYRG
jgi:hypothetical protein